MITLADLLGGAAPTTTPAITITEVTPVDLALPLLDHQAEAVRFALAERAVYLAHDMGTGKTATAIGIAASLVAAGEGPVLIVVPPSLRTNWVSREIPRFAPRLKVALLTGTKPHDVPIADMYVVGDSSVSGWADLITGTTIDGKDRRGAPIYRRTGAPLAKALIVDEAHRFKNGKSQRADALRRIADSCGPRRVLLSGTPAPNGRNMELASQIDILGMDAWNAIGGRARFWGHYCPKVDQWSRGNNDTAGLNLAMTTSWMQRLLRHDVLDLPSKGRSAIAIDGSGKAVRDYVAAEDDLISWLKEEGRNHKGAERSEALVRLTTLRALAGKAKVKAAVDHIKDILANENGGVFVVAEHHDVMDTLMLGLAQFDPVEVRGGMTDAQKQDSVDRFNAGTSRVLVGQIISAGVGLTLHGNGANHRVVVVQLPWTPADLQQAEDRLHRIGQTSAVTVEICLAHIEGRWTIDERLWSMLELKHFDSTSLVDGEGAFMLSDVHEGILDSYR